MVHKKQTKKSFCCDAVVVLERTCALLASCADRASSQTSESSVSTVQPGETSLKTKFFFFLFLNICICLKGLKDKVLLLLLLFFYSDAALNHF